MSYEYRFSWDPRKARSNRRKHGIAFEIAATVFQDPLAISVPDTDFGGRNNDRWITLAQAITGSLLVVVHTFEELDVNSARIRLISARRASRREKQHYESG